MRTAKFRDEVLHAVADKMGLDPEQSNFLTNQAIPIGKSIAQWVRRLYETRDWPEWVVTDAFVPVSHYVPFDYSETGAFSTNPKRIGRVLHVFLVNPDATDAPVDTTFTLENKGIHCGYEHGTTVWIRYMPPAPRFTAVQWASDQTYTKDDVVYSYRTGECYKSKVSNNRNHDPASTFSVPPHQSEPVSLPSPSIEITQERITTGAGVPGQPQILRISFSETSPGPDPVDPPPNLGLFAAAVDDQSGLTIAATSSAGDGTTPISDIMDQIRTALLSDPDLSGFTITNNALSRTMDIEHTSNFKMHDTGTAYYDPPPDNTVAHIFKVVQIQPFISPFSAASGQHQITQITLNDDTTFPGATYKLTVIESNGTTHVVDYASSLTDDSSRILNGLVLATESSTDDYWASVVKTFSPSNKTLSLSVNDEFSTHVDAQRPPPPGIQPPTAGGAFWELVPFPRALVEQVVRGAYADLLKEWGQTEKGASEEGSVPTETGISEINFDSTSTPALTQQERATSRYRT